MIRRPRRSPLFPSPTLSRSTTIGQGYAVARPRLLYVVRRQEPRHPRGGAQVPDELPQRAPRPGIEPRRRLVEEQDARPVQHTARDVGRAAHAAREGAHRRVAALRQPELPQQLVDPCRGGARPPREVPQPRGEAQVLLDREVAVERGLLKHQPDAAPHREALAHHVVPRDAGAPARGREQRSEDMDGGGLAGAVRPEEAKKLGLAHVEVEAVQRADRAEVLAQAARLDHPFAARAREVGAARYTHSLASAAALRSTSATASSTRWRCGDNEHTGSVTPASPAIRNAWQRQPPKSTVLRGQERHGSGIQASPRNLVKASEWCQIHSRACSRTFANLSVVMRPAAWHGHTSPAGVTVM